MDRPLWEDGHLAGREHRGHDARVVLLDGVGVGFARDGEDVIGSAGVEVQGEHAAGAELDHDWAELVADYGGKGGGVGGDDAGGGEGVAFLGVEVEGPVGGEEVEEVELGAAHAEVGD